VRRRLDSLPEPRERAADLARPATAAVRAADGRTLSARLLDAARLPPEAPVEGPALIEGYSSTTWAPEGWAARRDAAGNVLLRKGAGA
jgi:N-methylhydantoinase A